MKKPFILLLPVLLTLTGCEVFKPASRPTGPSAAENSGAYTGKSANPGFIQGISTESASAGQSEIQVKDKPLYHSQTTPANPGTDNYMELQYKYAILTNSPVEELTNQRLLVFMDQWYGVPYHYGGSTKEGIDCSAFASLLVSDVYNVNQLPRMSADQYQATRRVSKKNLREGDLVFFHTLGKGHRVTHVGVYLYNNRFVHASVSGVQISDLGEGYYKAHYVGAGRVVEQ